MVTWFMMKPIMHLCIKDLESVEINVSEPNITLLNLISHFYNHLLGMGKSSHHSFNIRMLIISCHEPYPNLSFWLFGECTFQKKLQLANKFSVSKVDFAGNTLLPEKKELKFSLFFFNQQCTYLLKTLLLKLIIVSSIVKAK